MAVKRVSTAVEITSNTPLRCIRRVFTTAWGDGRRQSDVDNVVNISHHLGYGRFWTQPQMGKKSSQHSLAFKPPWAFYFGFLVQSWWRLWVPENLYRIHIRFASASVRRSPHGFSCRVLPYPKGVNTALSKKIFYEILSQHIECMTEIIIRAWGQYRQGLIYKYIKRREFQI